LHVVVLGNSVARQNGFGTTKFLIGALQEFVGTRSQFKMDYANVRGGFHPDEVWRCGMGQLDHADIIIIQYEAFDPERAQIIESIVRYALQTPRKPLVIYISHCFMADFPSAPDWLASPVAGWLMGLEGAEVWRNLSKFRKDEVRFAKHYDITLVSTCAAYDSMLNQSCNDSQDSVDRVTALLPIFFAHRGRDPIHQSEKGSSLQACLATRAALTANVSSAGSDSMPARLFRDPGKDLQRASFCLAPPEIQKQATAADGWQLLKGGGGSSGCGPIASTRASS